MRKVIYSSKLHLTSMSIIFSWLYYTTPLLESRRMEKEDMGNHPTSAGLD